MSGYARLKVRGLLTKSNRKKFLQRPMKATKRTATSLTFRSHCSHSQTWHSRLITAFPGRRAPYIGSRRQLFQRAEEHVSLFAAPPRKVSAAKMFRKPKEFAQHFKRHFLKRHLRVRVLPPQPTSPVFVGSCSVYKNSRDIAHNSMASGAAFFLDKPHGTWTKIGIAIAGLVLGWVCYSIASNILTYMHTAPEQRR